MLANISYIYNQQNTQQYITLIIGIITELLSITISTLAFWFIPQSSEYSYNIIWLLSSIEWYMLTLIITNIVTYVVFLTIIIFEIFRENWLIKTFDYSRKYSSVHLTKYKQDYPEIFTHLEWYNKYYYRLYKVSRIILLINIIYSWICIINFRYADYRTITTLFTNSLICYNKIKKGIQVGKDCIKHNIGYSYYNTVNLSYNRIDAKIKKHTSNSSTQPKEHSFIDRQLQSHYNSTHASNINLADDQLDYTLPGMTTACQINIIEPQD